MYVLIVALVVTAISTIIPESTVLWNVSASVVVALFLVSGIEHIVKKIVHRRRDSAE